MRSRLLSLALILALVAACDVAATWPTGATLCRTDYDCGRFEHCGFQPGYTAAVCRSGAPGPVVAAPPGPTR